MTLKEMIFLLDKSPISIFEEIEDMDLLFVDKLETYDHTLQEDTLYFADAKTAESRIQEIEESEPRKMIYLLYCFVKGTSQTALKTALETYSACMILKNMKKPMIFFKAASEDRCDTITVSRNSWSLLLKKTTCLYC